MSRRQPLGRHWQRAQPLQTGDTKSSLRVPHILLTTAEQQQQLICEDNHRHILKVLPKMAMVGTTTAHKGLKLKGCLPEKWQRPKAHTAGSGWVPLSPRRTRTPNAASSLRPWQQKEPKQPPGLGTETKDTQKMSGPARSDCWTLTRTPMQMTDCQATAAGMPCSSPSSATRTTHRMARTAPAQGTQSLQDNVISFFNGNIPNDIDNTINMRTCAAEGRKCERTYTKYPTPTPIPRQTPALRAIGQNCGFCHSTKGCKSLACKFFFQAGFFTCQPRPPSMRQRS